MGAVHVLPGTTQSSAAEKGDYDSGKHATLPLAEFEDGLHLDDLSLPQHASRSPWANAVGCLG